MFDYDVVGLWRWLRGKAAPLPPGRLGGSGVQLASPWQDNTNLTRISFEEVFPGADPELLPLTRHQAMTVPSVAAARHRIVGTLARLPLRAVHAVDGKPWAGLTGLMDQPDPGEVPFITKRKTYDDLLFDGWSNWVVVRAYVSNVVDGSARWLANNVVHVPVDQVSVDSDGYVVLADSWLDWLKTARDLEPWEKDGRPWVITFLGPHDGLLGTLATCSGFGIRSIRAALSLDRSARTAADNPVPAVELHQTTADEVLGDDEIDALIDHWIRARRTKGVGYTNSAVELKTHGAVAEQLLIDGRNQAAVEVARLAGIPASAIDAGIPGSNLTYANLNDRVLDLVNFGLSQYEAAFSGRLSMDDCLPRGIEAHTDYSSLFPATTATAAGTGTNQTQQQNQPATTPAR